MSTIKQTDVPGSASFDHVGEVVENVGTVATLAVVVARVACASSAHFTCQSEGKNSKKWKHEKHRIFERTVKHKKIDKNKSTRIDR